MDLADDDSPHNQMNGRLPALNSDPNQKQAEIDNAGDNRRDNNKT